MVAVSGGPDSVALLHLFCRLREAWGWRLHVAHLDHQLRPEAEAEARFVWNLARDWGLGISLGREQVRSRARPGDSLEDVARRVRREFLLRVARVMGAEKVVLGHHADDQAETVLLHLLRGSGTGGLAGMAWQQGVFVRPLLEVTRAEIESYCSRHRLPFVRDPSNADPSFWRNRIRGELIPLLQSKFNPRIVEAVGQTAQVLAEEDRYLEEELDRLWPHLLSEVRPERVALVRSELAALPLALRRRAVRRAFFLLVGRENNFLTYRQVEEVLATLLGQPGKRISLPQGVTAFGEGERLVLSRKPPAPFPDDLPWPPCRRLPVPGRVQMGGWQIEAEILDREEGAEPGSRWQVDCDWDRLSGPLFLRYWQPGDYFWPRGLGRRKKLQDFFVDAKVPRAQRHRIPLVVCAEGIVWVVGYRPDERWKVTPATSRILRLYALPPSDRTTRFAGPTGRVGGGGHASHAGRVVTAPTDGVAQGHACYELGLCSCRLTSSSAAP